MLLSQESELSAAILQDMAATNVEDGGKWQEKSCDSTSSALEALCSSARYRVRHSSLRFQCCGLEALPRQKTGMGMFTDHGFVAGQSQPQPCTCNWAN